MELQCSSLKAPVRTLTAVNTTSVLHTAVNFYTNFTRVEADGRLKTINTMGTLVRNVKIIMGPLLATNDVLNAMNYESRNGTNQHHLQCMRTHISLEGAVRVRAKRDLHLSLHLNN